MVDLTDDLINFFKESLALIDIELNELQLKQFVRYAQVLVEWNSTRNLTSIEDATGIFFKHFYDSLNVLYLIEERSQVMRFLDLGSGAGFPGIPIKIIRPDITMTLCDSLRKRTDFLSFVINELDLSNIIVRHARAEDLVRQPSERESYSHVASRAVSQLPTLLEWCTPFLQVNGHFFAMKGPSAVDEWSRSLSAAKLLRVKLFSKHHYYLPLDMGERMILDFQKISPTPSRFPRKPGDALRYPL